METLGIRLPKFDVSYFLESVVPDVPEDKVDEVFQQLINEKILVYNATTEEHRWCWYDVDPSEMDGSENKVYKHLEDISEKVVKAGKEVWKIEGEQQTVRFTCRPNHASLSDTQNSGFMTDGDQELIKNDNPNGGKDLLDSVTTAEFKKKAGKDNTNDNVRKLLGNSTHMMSSDPRRRFRFGITIEDTQMRFWYFSRALNFVTHDFNFITNPKPFIQFLLATSFATPADLGFDPTVVRLNVEGGWAYDYRVDHPEDGTQWYRTVESLDTHRAARLPGRGVRIWVVKPLDQNHQPYTKKDKRYVLKDYWLPMDSKSEKEISDAIAKAAVDKGRDAADVRKHFMTIKHDAVVLVSGRNDDSNLHLRQKMPPSEYDETHILEEASGLDTSAEKSQDAVPMKPERTWMFEPRVHRRLVFKEVGQPLNTIRDQKVLAQCLTEALEGLHDFYRAGYVHRDISSGNLLRCKLKGGGYICKIFDLEYARPYLGVGSKPQGCKIGTPAFMVIEVQVGYYVFGPLFNFLATTSGQRPSFVHNYLHDVEGLWWIMMYNLFSTGPTSSPDDLDNRKAKRDALFPTSINDSVVRRDFMMNVEIRERYVSTLPRSYQALADNMTEALVRILKFYLAVDRDVLNHASFKNVYDTLLPFFERAKELGVEGVVSLEDLRLTSPATLKRSRAGDGIDGSDPERVSKNRKTLTEL
ncbi:hypothetical protein PM082_009200 [Marasmius tenuissimus]|nr:hypothetical protein PM082_009200 [Marasmius tenuissimus]